jgi:glycosyltransferase involved in cell wall biosynthesis
MKITWLSSRVLGTDLCSTTQINLANGLSNRGHKVVLYSPGRCREEQFRHVAIFRSSIKGLQARSVVKNLKTYINEIEKSDVILLDWTLGALINKFSSPVILMDRSPPADRGILAKLQWHRWKKSWGKAVRGTTVSTAHRKFVMDATGMPSASIRILQAGVDIEKFFQGEKDNPIRMVYHGRVDNSRNVMLLPRILEGLQQKGIDATLHIHGIGDAINRLKNIDLDGLEVTRSIAQNKLVNLLSTYDIGLLPMPVNKVWNLASPLKRSEYLASGLVVCGVDHSGHQLNDSGDWLQLFEQKSFIKDTVNWIASLDRQLLTAHQKEARAYAEGNLSWSHSIDALESMILS